jgi:hypothetical protein
MNKRETLLGERLLVLHEKPALDALASVCNHPKICGYGHHDLYAKYHDRAAASADGSVEVTYYRGDFGRYYAEGSSDDPETHPAFGHTCTTMWANARSPCFEATDGDVDAVQCHPMLLLTEMEAAQQRDANCPAFAPLAHMCQNRDAVFDACRLDPKALDRYNEKRHSMCVERDVWKSLATLVVFGGTVKTWAVKWGLKGGEWSIGARMDAYAACIPSLANYVSALPEHKACVDWHVEKRKRHRVKAKRVATPGSKLAIILQDIEATLLLRVMRYFHSIDIDPTCYTYDGAQFPKPATPKEQAAFDAALAHVNTFHSRAKFVVKDWRPAPIDPALDQVEPRVPGQPRPLDLPPGDRRAVIGTEMWNGDAGRAALYKHFFGADARCVDAGEKSRAFRLCHPKSRIWEASTSDLMLLELRRVMPLVEEFALGRAKLHDARMEALNQRVEEGLGDVSALKAQIEQDATKFAVGTKALKGFTSGFNSSISLKNALPLLAGMLYDQAFESTLDNTPGQLSVFNGMLDVTAKPPVLRVRQASDLVTFRCKAAYDADMACPHFESFVKGIFDNRRLNGQGHRAEAYICRVLGLSLFGFFAQMMLPVLVFNGPGGNGKSLLGGLLEWLTALEGGKSLRGLVKSQALTDPKEGGDGEAPAGSIALLRGKRFCVIDETKEVLKLGQGFKGLCGTFGLKILARQVHKRDVEFEQNAGVVILCNDFPVCDGEAVKRRLKPMPMFNQYRPTGQYDASHPDHLPADLALGPKMQKELPGILALLARCAADGYAAMQAHGDGLHGMSLPQAVGEFARKQFQAADWTALFECKPGCPRLKYKSATQDEPSAKAAILASHGADALRGLTNPKILERLQASLGPFVGSTTAGGTQYLTGVALKCDAETKGDAECKFE